ncbi:MAG: DUF2878 domain-containing protein [Phycisphaerales bacterium]|nr:MAG: DUF2878 domain-containing protein [Phycisphaerales bacterium]
MKTLLYVVGETVGWFACILGAAHHRHWLGALAVMGLLGLHFVTRGERSARRILMIMLMSVLFGFCFDSLLILGGVYAPARWLIPSPFATIWLMALWANFSLIVDVPLRWLQQHLVVAAVFGGVFGPFAYLGGQRLGAIQIGEPASFNIAVLTVAWAFGLALLMLLARLLPVYRSGPETPAEA